MGEQGPGETWPRHTAEQCPSLAQRPVPTEHLAGSSAAQTTWMLKSRGSINCRPSRGRGRQTWSRNAARAAAQPGPGGQPPATEGSLEQLGAQKQSQGLQYSPARLQEQLGATQAQEQQSLQQLSRTNEAIQGLHRKVAELQQQLCWQVQDMENLQAELAQAWQESTKQAEKIAAYKTHRQQLYREPRRMQTFKEQTGGSTGQQPDSTSPA
ncbi:uncharacterized protein LOC115907706 [Camarhynchus parvulus]|uniref:uncharacterized protein LOC115907706 n=1 Tax=Geospiza parvula TaxID=87175 RepID=UPI001237E262|nr:uncharacterized protein LOC115907706 [Camarhynchus parvulus]